jgi:hypothetical protein
MSIVLTVEINEDAAVTDASCRVVEEGHPIRGLLYRGWVMADQLHEVAGVDDGVAKGEDALVATSRGPRASAQQKDDTDKKEDARGDATVCLILKCHLNAVVTFAACRDGR